MHYTDTLNTDTTLDIDDTQATVSYCNNPSAHSRLRSMFGYFAERASLAGYEPTEQFEDLSSHNCASKPGDSKISSISSSSCSRQKLPRRRSQVLFHMIRRREIGRDNEGMNTDGLPEKNGARMKTRSPGISSSALQQQSALLNEFEDDWAILEHEDHDEEQLEIPSAAPSAAEHLGVPSEATTAAALSEAPAASEQSEAPAASKPATHANRMTESMEPALQGEVLPRMWSLVRTSKFPKYHSPGNQFERFRGGFGIDWQVRIRFSSVRKLFF